MKQDRIYKLYEWMNFFYQKKVPIIPNVIMRYIRLRFGCYVPFSCSIGKGTRFPHDGIGIVIHEHAVIGSNCKVMQNVTIGGRNGSKGAPKIGQNVFIGAGAVIIGDIVVGNNVNIGANAVVLISIPDNSTAVGVPARIIN